MNFSVGGKTYTASLATTDASATDAAASINATVGLNAAGVFAVVDGGSVAEALACHQAGRLQHAGQMYGSVLERNPENSDAWHLLGRLALQEGDHSAAAARVLQAIRRRPRIPAYHTSLGEIPFNDPHNAFQSHFFNQRGLVHAGA